jgi:N-methylhydantoinase A
VDAFHVAHERRFGYADRMERVQVVNARVKARGATQRPVAKRLAGVAGAVPEPVAVRPVVFDSPAGAVALDTPIYQRTTLSPGAAFIGPAIVAQYDTTTVLPPGWRATIDVAGSLIVEPVEEEWQARGN